ncbi:hypothetical protein C8Q78DRAFT_238118 [Trametes maxima]|nr:hypothetical protein C8Q78DRAFT_238118 [Trametes maxima]
MRRILLRHRGPAAGVARARAISLAPKCAEFDQQSGRTYTSYGSRDGTYAAGTPSRASISSHIYAIAPGGSRFPLDPSLPSPPPGPTPGPRPMTSNELTNERAARICTLASGNERKPAEARSREAAKKRASHPTIPCYTLPYPAQGADAKVGSRAARVSNRAIEGPRTLSRERTQRQRVLNPHTTGSNAILTLHYHAVELAE